MSVNLKPHQRTAADKLANGKILFGLPGSGKTHAALGYYSEKEAPRPLYVITTAKKRDDQDWQITAGQFGVFPPSSPGFVGTVVVDSWNNIGKYTEVEDGFFIFDEQRLVGSGAWVKSFYKIAKKNRWVMLSGTPGDTWLDFIPVFVANGFYANKTRFVEEHVKFVPYTKFPKVDRYLGTSKLLRLKESIIVDMPFERHTVQHIKHVPVEYNKDLFLEVLKKRWHVYEERPLKNVAELFGVMRKVVNSDESRIASVRSLMRSHPRLIVFYNFDYELEMLRTLVDGPKSDTWTTEELLTPQKRLSLGIEQTPTPVDTTLSSEQQDTPSTDCPFGGASPVRNSSLATSPTNGTTSLMWSTTCTCTTPSERLPTNKSSRNSDESSLTGTSCTHGRTDKSCHTNLSSGSTTRPVDSQTLPQKSEPSSTKSSTGECLRTTSASTRRSSTKPGTPISPQHIRTVEPTQRLVDTGWYIPDPAPLDGSTSVSAVDCGATRSRSDGPSKTTNGTTNTDVGSTSGELSVAEWNGHKHEPIPTGDRWVYLVQYAAGAEGWNCTTTDATIFFSMTYSYKLFKQAKGRIDRLNTPYTDLFYYVLKSDSLIDKAIWKSLQEKKNFNEAEFAGEMVEND